MRKVWKRHGSKKAAGGYVTVNMGKLAILTLEKHAELRLKTLEIAKMIIEIAGIDAESAKILKELKRMQDHIQRNFAEATDPKGIIRL